MKEYNTINCADKSACVKKDTHKCSITGETYVGFGNNAYPFKGRCSDFANREYVIPARLSGVTPEIIQNFGGNKAFAKYMDECFGRK